MDSPVGPGNDGDLCLINSLSHGESVAEGRVRGSQSCDATAPLPRNIPAPHPSLRDTFSPKEKEKYNSLWLTYLVEMV